MPGHFDFNQYYRCNFALPLTKKCVVKTGSRWSDVTAELTAAGYVIGRPVVLHRQGSSSNVESPSPGSMPAPTLCFAVGDLIFEVMQNDYIATITICSKRPCSNVS